MKVVAILETRQAQWRELERLCALLESSPRATNSASYRAQQSLNGPPAFRMASLYRSACADLALADSYQLPPNTVNYLHQLVARAHNHLYRSRRFDLKGWWKELFFNVPQRLFRDNYLRLAFVLFWGLFITSMLLAKNSHDYAEKLIGESQISNLQEMYKNPLDGRDAGTNAGMFTFYVMHNAGIGLECFSWGLLLGIGGLFKTVFNAAFLGGIFGYMASLTTPERNHFFEFVTAHGPFELTAIILSAAAGMRMGFSLISTNGLSRSAALTAGAKEAFPTACAGMILFILAAMIEGFISPSSLPYWVKAATAAVTSGLLMFYFLYLGYPRAAEHGRPE